MAEVLHSASVLIVSDDPAFARAVTTRWQSEPRPPGITVANSDIWHQGIVLAYDLVIAGGVRGGASASILNALCAAAVPAAVYIADQHDDPLLLRSKYPQLPVIVRQQNWLDALILVSIETLRRIDAVARSQRAERLAQQSFQEANLGRYVLAMRPSINDALTSVLGNADLLLLGAHGLTAETCEQVRTIQTMALRLHQAMQRFSSLAAEIKAGEMDSHDETAYRPEQLAIRS